MMAGSVPHFLAANGSSAPTRLPISTTPTMEMATVRATMGPAPMLHARSDARTASNPPRISPEMVSFRITLPMSESRISPSVSPRTTRVEAWVPELPPVPISMGMKKASATTLSSANEYLCSTRVEKSWVTMQIRSHDSLLRARVKTPACRYSRSTGLMPAIRSKSSVVSSWMTSIMSSKVRIPTILSSLSTTGRACRS
ncbi:MAG: hypothetical protein BWY99_02778 [Synergistetes bacterium ADurb.BinA166]|nr:MAG: hypothetical protein BWY99_02778 [Synergistetes bacterium ADurb.BinA166]